jgi:hypothetical protein
LTSLGYIVREEGMKEGKIKSSLVFMGGMEKLLWWFSLPLVVVFVGTPLAGGGYL